MLCGFLRNTGHGGEFYSVMSDVGLKEEYEVLLVLLCNLKGEIWSQSVVSLFVSPSEHQLPESRTPSLLLFPQ